MSRIWAEIQRDKHIFPYVQILVTKDGRTSDICEPLQFDFWSGGPSTDGFNRVTKKYMDVKAATGTNGKNIIQSALKGESKQQTQEVIVYLRENPDSYMVM